MFQRHTYLIAGAVLTWLAAVALIATLIEGAVRAFQAVKAAAQ